MASNTLYPPVVNNVEPAFVTIPASLDGGGSYIWPQGAGQLKVYFKFSALNSDLDENNISVHATIHYKAGSSIVNLVDGSNEGTMSGYYRLRATQIILNLKPEHVENTDYWYVTLLNEDVMGESAPSISPRYYGWVPGEIYKIQLRLSDVCCLKEEVSSSTGENVPVDQQKWLYDNADHFSEWTDVIYSKCISDVNIKHDDEYHFEDSWSEPLSISYPQIFQGQITCIDNRSNEHYSSCLLKIYESNANQEKIKLIEEKTIYPNEISYDNYKYTIKYNFDTEKLYLMEFSFITDNQYQSDIFVCWFQYTFNTSQICNYKLTTVDFADHSLVQKIKNNAKYYSSFGQENDNGCIGLKLEYDPYNPENEFVYDHVNLRILRSGEDSNFTIWEEIKYINLNFDPTEIETEQDLIDALEKFPMIFDYTIESNTFYQYSIQSMIPDIDGWTHMKKIPSPIQRDFDYSYIVGKDQKQLKIKFNDNINSYTSQVYDSKLEPIGSKYPYVDRNSDINYKTFSISGTISFEMDDNDTFLPNGDLDIYNYEEVNNLHKNDFVYGKYNYGYERRFRQKVLEFLQNGENKLFKSSTEGNILVRLRDISCTPNQQLSRLIYNFSCNADEIGNNDLDNLKQNGILYPGTYVTDWTKIPYTPIPDENADINAPHLHNISTTAVMPYLSNRNIIIRGEQV